jgi:hypothetical protein
MPMRFESTPGRGLQKMGSCYDILIFRRSRRTGVIRLVECTAVADAEPVVDGQDNETVRCQLRSERESRSGISDHYPPARRGLARAQ